MLIHIYIYISYMIHLIYIYIYTYSICTWHTGSCIGSSHRTGPRCRLTGFPTCPGAWGIRSLFCIAFASCRSAATLLQLAMASRFAAFAQRGPLVVAHQSPACHSHLSRPSGRKQPCFQPLPPRGVQRVIPAHKLFISKLILLLSTLPLRTPLAALDSGDLDGENNHGRSHDAVTPPIFRPIAI